MQEATRISDWRRTWALIEWAAPIDELKPPKKTKTDSLLRRMLILHGRSGMKEDYLAVAERYRAIGFRCLIPDLPGHGGEFG